MSLFSFFWGGGGGGGRVLGSRAQDLGGFLSFRVHSTFRVFRLRVCFGC